MTCNNKLIPNIAVRAKEIEDQANAYRKQGSKSPIREAIDDLSSKGTRGWHPIDLAGDKAAALRVTDDDEVFWMVYPLDEHPEATSMTICDLERLTDGFVAGLNAAENNWETT